MEGKNNKGVIVLLVVIIVMLSVLCVLFATNKITFNKDNGVNNNVNLVEDNELNNNISEWEIKEKFLFVYDYNVLPVVYCGENQTGMIKIGEKDYYMSYEFKTYDEMLSYLNKYMSEEVMSNKYAFAATNKQYYLEKDNKLYCEVTYKGYVYGHDVKDIEIVKEENYKINFVGNMELTDSEGNKTYDKVNCVIEYIDNNWIITSYEKQNN